MAIGARIQQVKVSQLGLILFNVLLLLQVLLIWLLPVFITQDGPSHLYNANILLDFVLHGNQSFFATFYQFNSELQPNWFQHTALAGLLYFFSPVISEKIFVSCYMIAIALTFKKLLKVLSPDANHLLPLIFVLANGFFLLFGFYNFQWSFVFLMLALSLLLQQDKDFKWTRTLFLAIIYCCTFFVHPVALVFMMFLLLVNLAIAIKKIIRTSNEIKRVEKGRLWSPFLVGILPGILFYQYFSYHQGGGYDLLVNNLNLEYLSNLLGCFYLKAFMSIESILITCYAALLFMLLLPFFLDKENRKLTPIRCYIIAMMSFGLGAYFFAAPSMGGGSWLTQRLTLFIYLSVLLLAGTLKFSKRLKIASMVLGGLLVLALLIVRYPKHVKISSMVSEYLEVSQHLPKQGIILPLGFSNRGEINNEKLSPRLEIFKHISGYLGADRNLLILDNYEANTSIFPLRWKEEVNPYVHLCRGGVGGIEMNPPSVNILHYNEVAIHPIDYVLLWGDETRFESTENLIQLKEELSQRYTLIYRSSDGLSQLYQLN